MLHGESLVMQVLERLELEGQQLITKCRIEALVEQFLLIFIICHIPGGIASQASELTTISFNSHSTLGQI